MRYITKPLKWEFDRKREVSVSTNGVREYEIAKMVDTTSTYVASSVDGAIYSYANSFDDAETVCEKDQEKLVRSVLKDEVLEILENLPD